MLCLMIVQAANTEMSRQMAKIAELPTPRGGRPVLETRGARAPVAKHCGKMPVAAWASSGEKTAGWALLRTSTRKFNKASSNQATSPAKATHFQIPDRISASLAINKPTFF
jgi:hypothetical protein